MYSLEVIKASNEQAAKLAQTETTRESSSHVSPRGLVLHSACHRSTAFVDRDCEAYERHVHFAQHPDTRDTFIPLIVEGWGDVGAVRETIRRVYGVETRRVKGTGTHKGETWSAQLPSGKLVKRISAQTDIQLHNLILTH